MSIQEYLKQVDEVIANGVFKDSWESLSAHKTPSWYKSGKLGLFIHWGVYSVPQFFNEWYPRQMYLKGSKVNLHHKKVYGGVEKFPYKNFVPMFKAEKFNPDEWLDIFKRSGAKYIMPVGEHHDGFKMYASKLNRWNSVEMGPKRDIMKELHESCDKYGIGFLTSSHRAEHFFFLNGSKDYDCDITRGEDRDFYGPSYCIPGKHPDSIFGDPEYKPTKEWVEDWLASSCELIDHTQPLAVYFDWWVDHREFHSSMKKFLAYYYNRAIEWGKEVTVFYKNDAIMKGCATYDVERGQLDGVSPFIWQNDTAIAKNSWGYTEGNQFKSASEVVCNLIDVVSKNGCFMLNVGPKADGTICDEEKAVLLKMGEWLSVNGEGIYDSEPYRIYGESKKRRKHGAFSENFVYTSDDIRYTYKTGYIYAYVLKKSKKNTYKLRTILRSNSSEGYQVKGIELLGFNNKVESIRKGSELILNVEGELNTDMPICFKIAID